MNRRFYTKFAWMGIEKNKRLYVPYFTAGMIMVMIFYILHFLADSDVVRDLPGEGILAIMFSVGTFAAGLFAVLFLFYINSTLIKGRKKELGLYNILGMNKKNIFCMLFWETVITYGITVLGGIFAGAVFAKAAELAVVNAVGKEVNYRVYVDWKAVGYSLLVFMGIYVLILLNMLRQIHYNNPIELLHSAQEGERPPKARGGLALISMLLLAAAYYMAVTMGNLSVTPRDVFARSLFGVVVLVTVGTFLLFLCVSVFLCRLLQNHKKYYYKTSHFVTVSSMAYRMKRNGASLSFICILSTLVIAVFGFTVSFYVGTNKVLANLYPYDLGVSVNIPLELAADKEAAGSYTEKIRSEAAQKMEELPAQSDCVEIYSAEMAGIVADGSLDLSQDMQKCVQAEFTTGEQVLQPDEKIAIVRLIALDDYNRLCHAAETLKEDEVLLAKEGQSYQIKEVVLHHGEKKKCRTTDIMPKMPAAVKLRSRNTHANGLSQIFLVVSDVPSFLDGKSGMQIYAERNLMAYRFEYGLEYEGVDRDLQNAYYEITEDKLLQDAYSQTVDDEIFGAYENGFVCYLQTEKAGRMSALTSGLLVLMVTFNILFIIITALIMYYKQISEGYEDQKRFVVMRKIGMTAEEIKRSVNSQMFFVFWLPLTVAGIHLLFTANIVYSLLSLSVADDRPLTVKVMIMAFLIFAVVYLLFYSLTSRTYYRIVNRPE